MNPLAETVAGKQVLYVIPGLSRQTTDDELQVGFLSGNNFVSGYQPFPVLVRVHSGDG